MRECHGSQRLDETHLFTTADNNLNKVWKVPHLLGALSRFFSLIRSAARSCALLQVPLGGGLLPIEAMSCRRGCGRVEGAVDQQ